MSLLEGNFVEVSDGDSRVLGDRSGGDCSKATPGADCVGGLDDSLFVVESTRFRVPRLSGGMGCVYTEHCSLQSETVERGFRAQTGH